VVLCVDEKSQAQALEQAAPVVNVSHAADEIPAQLRHEDFGVRGTTSSALPRASPTCNPWTGATACMRRASGGQHPSGQGGQTIWMQTG
jgi:hypothetical protein